jgi:predicted DNA-binding transcriptional regulator AlpA
VVGIDDWAWRRGYRYGTIICDLERSEVIDILPDREVATVVKWLKAHPGIEIITRDRAKCYREAATTGAPQAVQIADRWHLLKNLTDAVKRVLEGYQPLLKDISIKMIDNQNEPIQPQSPVETQICHPLEMPDDIETLEKHLQDPPLAPAIRRRLMLSLIHRLREADVPIKEMLVRTGMSRATLYRYFNQDVVTLTVIQPTQDDEKPLSASQFRRESIEQLRDAGITIAEIMQQVGVSRATVYRVLTTMNKSHKGRRDYFPGVEVHYWSTRFHELWQAGDRDTDVLWQTLRQEGYTMSFASVRLAVYRQLSPLSTTPTGMTTHQVYRPRKAAWCFVLDPLKLDKIDYQFLLMSLYASPELLQLYALAQGFHRLIVQSRRLILFEHWIAQALSSAFPEIQQFARGLLQDERAVRAALTYSWSNGPVEGQVLRLKLKRRSMYGRGNLDLLKRRVMGMVN